MAAQHSVVHKNRVIECTQADWDFSVDVADNFMVSCTTATPHHLHPEHLINIEYWNDYHPDLSALQNKGPFRIKIDSRTEFRILLPADEPRTWSLQVWRQLPRLWTRTRVDGSTRCTNGDSCLYPNAAGFSQFGRCVDGGDASYIPSPWDLLDPDSFVLQQSMQLHADGTCSDGGGSSSFIKCPYGTDCFDCGNNGGDIGGGFAARTAQWDDPRP